MDVEVTGGSWSQDMIMQVRVGEVRRHAELQDDAKVSFPHLLRGPQQMQVDVFRRVGTETVTVEPSEPCFNLNMRGEGLSGIQLRVEHKLEIAECADGALTEDRLQRLRVCAADYIERWDLREALQDVFQKVIRDRPEDPYLFMQGYLHCALGSSAVDRAAAGTDAVAAGRAEADPSPAVASNDAAELEALQLRVQELEAAVAEATGAAKQGDAKTAELVNEKELQLELARRREEDAEERRRNTEIALSREEQRRLASDQDHAEQLGKQRATICTLERRIQDLERQAPAAPAPEPADLAATQRYEEQLGTQRVQIDQLQRQLKAAEAAGGATAAGGDSAAGGVPAVATVPRCLSKEFDKEAAAASELAVVQATQVGSEVQTHMLSQLLAATYAPPLPMMMFDLPQEETGETELSACPEVLVAVSDCTDTLSNGVYAWVCEFNGRPMYRLLGSEPRYLYFGGFDIAACWRIVENPRAEGFLDRFLDPGGAQLPTECARGESTSTVAEARLTCGIVGQISLVGSIEEKVAIRAKFGEVYGPSFERLEGAQRGLTSKESPVLAVARALEGQQRAIQLLHRQLSAEALRREAAEAHAQTMEEALDTLQLRIQAQLPGPPSVGDLQRQVRQNIAGQQSRSELPDRQDASWQRPEPADAVLQSQDRAVILRKNGDTTWAPDLGQGMGPMARPPVSPKEKKPVPPPTFSRLPTGLRPRPGSAKKGGAGRVAIDCTACHIGGIADGPQG